MSLFKGFLQVNNDICHILLASGKTSNNEKWMVQHKGVDFGQFQNGKNIHFFFESGQDGHFY